MRRTTNFVRPSELLPSLYNRFSRTNASNPPAPLIDQGKKKKKNWTSIFCYREYISENMLIDSFHYTTYKLLDCKWKSCEKKKSANCWERMYKNTSYKRHHGYASENWNLHNFPQKLHYSYMYSSTEVMGLFGTKI